MCSAPKTKPVTRLTAPLKLKHAKVAQGHLNLDTIVLNYNACINKPSPRQWPTWPT